MRRTRFRSRPLMLELSVNNLCNLRCVMCNAHDNPPRRLDPDLVIDPLLEELLPTAMVLMPSSGSEPFLGDLDLLGQACLKHETQLNLVTNGTLITKDRLEVIAPVIGRLNISLDGHRRELYESIRKGADFDHVLKNVKVAVDVARREGFELMLSAVASVDIVPEMDEFVGFAAGLGADGVAFQKIHHSTKEAVELDAFHRLDDNLIRTAMEVAFKAAENLKIDIHFDFPPPEKREVLPARASPISW